MSICESCGMREPSYTEKYPNLGLFACGTCRSLTFRGSEALNPSRLYSKEYFQDGEYKDYVGHRDIHLLNFKRKWRILRPYLKEPVRLFEVGCAYGFFVEYARQQGAKDVFGIDISSDAIAQATERLGSCFEIADGKNRPGFAYNFLAAWDVWEHLEHPMELFAELVADLAPGGIIALTTVDSSSLVARLRGPRWRQIHPPTHLQYPTRQALAQGFRRLGLEVVYQRYFGYHRALEQYLEALGLREVPGGLKRLGKFAVKLDLRDTQFLIARKPA